MGHRTRIEAPAPVRISARFFTRLGMRDGPCDGCSTRSGCVDMEPIPQLWDRLEQCAHVVAAPDGDDIVAPESREQLGEPAGPFDQACRIGRKHVGAGIVGAAGDIENCREKEIGGRTVVDSRSSLDVTILWLHGRLSNAQDSTSSTHVRCKA